MWNQVTSLETLVNGYSVKRIYIRPSSPYFIVLAGSVKTLEVKDIEFHRIPLVWFFCQVISITPYYKLNWIFRLDSMPHDNYIVSVYFRRFSGWWPMQVISQGDMPECVDDCTLSCGEVWRSSHLRCGHHTEPPCSEVHGWGSVWGTHTGSCHVSRTSEYHYVTVQNGRRIVFCRCLLK